MVLILASIALANSYSAAIPANTAALVSRHRNTTVAVKLRAYT